MLNYSYANNQQIHITSITTDTGFVLQTNNYVDLLNLKKSAYEHTQIFMKCDSYSIKCWVVDTQYNNLKATLMAQKAVTIILPNSTTFKVIIGSISEDMTFERGSQTADLSIADNTQSTGSRINFTIECKRDIGTPIVYELSYKSVIIQNNDNAKSFASFFEPLGQLEDTFNRALNQVSSGLDDLNYAISQVQGVAGLADDINNLKEQIVATTVSIDQLPSVFVNAYDVLFGSALDFENNLLDFGLNGSLSNNDEVLNQDLTVANIMVKISNVIKNLKTEPIDKNTLEKDEKVYNDTQIKLLLSLMMYQFFSILATKLTSILSTTNFTLSTNCALINEQMQSQVNDNPNLSGFIGNIFSSTISLFLSKTIINVKKVTTEYPKPLALLLYENNTTEPFFNLVNKTQDPLFIQGEYFYENV